MNRVKYRLSVKPLTEKTENKPEYGEVLVNTEDGNISVMTSNGVKSATKDINSLIIIKEVLLSEMSDKLEELNRTIDNNVNLMNSLRNVVDGTNDSLIELKSKINTIYSQLDVGKTNSKYTLSLLFEYYIILSNLTVSMLDIYDEIERSKRFIEEIGYLDNLLIEFKKAIDTDIANLKNIKTSVKANVDSRVYTTTFNSWKDSLLNSYARLKTTYGQVESLSFKYNS